MKKKELAQLLQTAAIQCEVNTFASLGFPDEPMWDKPMMGFAAGNDPLFSFLKEDIGDFYMTPLEVFRTKYPETESAADLTVVSLAFSQTANTKSEQGQQKEEPALRWMLTRNTWKQITDDLYERISHALTMENIRFVIPDLMPQMAIKQSEKYGMSAVWSQRHTAMIAGLGTFGLSEGLITRQGIAMRFASVIIDQKMEADKRPYEHHQQWCRFYQDGSCGMCIKRCPVGAITKEGHDKEKCKAYLDEMENRYREHPLIDPAIEVGCGLCQGGVPCSCGGLTWLS